MRPIREGFSQKNCRMVRDEEILEAAYQPLLIARQCTYQ